MAQIAYYDSGNLAFKQIGGPQAETFTVPGGYNKITQVKLKLRRVGSPGGVCTAGIYTVSGNYPSGYLGSADYSCAAVGGSGTYNWYIFTFATPITVVAGVTYAIQFTAPTNTANSIYWFGNGSWAGGVGSRTNPSWGVTAWDYSVDVYAENYLPPTVSTGTAGSIATTSFIVNGNNVSSDNGSAITERGIVYSTSSNPPTTADTKVATAGTTGSYNTTTGTLVRGTHYYARAFATNAMGTSYGSTIQVDTLQEAPTISTGTAGTITTTNFVMSGNNVTNDGGATITERGIVYSSSVNPPTTAHTKVATAGTTGSYNTTTGTLSKGTLYYVRAFATNAIGTSYGSVVQATTLTEAPTVTSGIIDTLTTTSFILSGNDVTDDGGTAITQRGIVYSDSVNPPTTAHTKVTTSGTTGIYDSLSGTLSPNQHYYIRAFATNSVGTSYGSLVQTTTLIEASITNAVDFILGRSIPLIIANLNTDYLRIRLYVNGALIKSENIGQVTSHTIVPTRAEIDDMYLESRNVLTRTVLIRVDTFSDAGYSSQVGVSQDVSGVMTKPADRPFVRFLNV